MERSQVWDAWLLVDLGALSVLCRDNLSHRETLLDRGSFAVGQIVQIRVQTLLVHKALKRMEVGFRECKMAAREQMGHAEEPDLEVEYMSIF
jgi:hypothetical protein